MDPNSGSLMFEDDANSAFLNGQYSSGSTGTDSCSSGSSSSVVSHNGTPAHGPKGHCAILTLSDSVVTNKQPTYASSSQPKAQMEEINNADNQFASFGYPGTGIPFANPRHNPLPYANALHRNRGYDDQNVKQQDVAAAIGDNGQDSNRVESEYARHSAPPKVEPSRMKYFQHDLQTELETGVIKPQQAPKKIPENLPNVYRKSDKESGASYGSAADPTVHNMQPSSLSKAPTENGPPYPNEDIVAQFGHVVNSFDLPKVSESSSPALCNMFSGLPSSSFEIGSSANASSVQKSQAYITSVVTVPKSVQPVVSPSPQNLDSQVQSTQKVQQLFQGADLTTVQNISTPPVSPLGSNNTSLPPVLQDRRRHMEQQMQLQFQRYYHSTAPPLVSSQPVPSQFSSTGYFHQGGETQSAAPQLSSGAQNDRSDSQSNLPHQNIPSNPVVSTAVLQNQNQGPASQVSSSPQNIQGVARPPYHKVPSAAVPAAVPQSQNPMPQVSSSPQNIQGVARPPYHKVPSAAVPAVVPQSQNPMPQVNSSPNNPPGYQLYQNVPHAAQTYQQTAQQSQVYQTSPQSSTSQNPALQNVPHAAQTYQQTAQKSQVYQTSPQSSTSQNSAPQNVPQNYSIYQNIPAPNQTAQNEPVPQNQNQNSGQQLASENTTQKYFSFQSVPFTGQTNQPQSSSHNAPPLNPPPVEVQRKHPPQQSVTHSQQPASFGQSNVQSVTSAPQSSPPSYFPYQSVSPSGANQVAAPQSQSQSSAVLNPVPRSVSQQSIQPAGQGHIAGPPIQNQSSPAPAGQGHVAGPPIQNQSSPAPAGPPIQNQSFPARFTAPQNVRQKYLPYQSITTPSQTSPQINYSSSQINVQNVPQYPPQSQSGTIGQQTLKPLSIPQSQQNFPSSVPQNIPGYTSQTQFRNASVQQYPSSQHNAYANQKYPITTIQSTAASELPGLAARPGPSNLLAAQKQVPYAGTSLNSYPPAVQQQQQQSYILGLNARPDIKQQYQPQYPPSQQMTTQRGYPQQPVGPGYGAGSINAMSDQFSNLGIARSGFNALRGMECVDLLRCRDILPKEGVQPPPIALPGSEINCSQDIIRCTLRKVPETKSVLDKCRLPLGILLHPFRDLNPLTVIQCGTIVRCRGCRTYINPFVYFPDSRRWRCNLCFRTNELPDDFLYNATTRLQDDPSNRPEVTNATIEFIAPSEYMVRPPQPAIYMFIFDVSRVAAQSGYLKVVCDLISLHLDKLPGDSRTSVGFITFDKSVHFYSLSEGVSQPQQIVVSDIDDVFLPFPDDLIVNLQENLGTVRTLLSQIPTKYAESSIPHSALGAALSAAYKLMAPTGGRVTVFQTCLPNFGPGALKPREDPNQRGGDKVLHLKPATDFYKKLGLECNGVHIAVDFFVLNSMYVDLATISGITQISAGCMHHFPLFNATNAVDVDKFEKVFSRYLTRKIGFEAVMRLRCTRGLAVHSFHGNFFVRTTDLLALPNINPDAGFGMQVSIEESLSDLQNVTIQAALLYTSSKGERRIRVHTLCLPVSADPQEIVASADQQCVVGLLAKMAVDSSLKDSIVDAREAFLNAVVDSLKVCQTLVAPSSQNTLLSYMNVSLFPLYVLALMKQVAFRASPATRIDDRTYAMYQMKCLPLDRLMKLIYPDLYAVHKITEAPTIEVDGEQVPNLPLLQLSAERVESSGLYLLDDGEVLILFVGQTVLTQTCVNFFGTTQYSAIPEGLVELSQVDSQENKSLHSFIQNLQLEKPHSLPLHIIKHTSPNRARFFEKLLEDKTETGVSYYEFLQTVRSKLSK